MKEVNNELSQAINESPLNSLNKEPEYLNSSPENILFYGTPSVGGLSTLF
jgi:DNA replication protein DnaC